MRNKRKVRTGLVISDKMDKTIVVRVDSLKPHPKYKKVYRTSTKFHAHDEKEEANIGDTVTIMETRPLSRTKCWRIVKIVKVADKQKQEYEAKMLGEK